MSKEKKQVFYESYEGKLREYNQEILNNIMSLMNKKKYSRPSIKKRANPFFKFLRKVRDKHERS